MIYRRKKTSHIILFTLGTIPVLLFASSFVEVPLTINTYSEVFPKQKWILTLDSESGIVSNLIDYTQGHSSHYKISNFERGEFISADFQEYIKDKKEFSKGDTVLYMRSSNVNDQLIAAEGELETAIAKLKSQSTAQKEPLIEEAGNKVKLMQTKIEEQKNLLERTQKLFEKGYSSQQEYELQKWNLDLLEIEKKVYAAQLENLKTGVKPEEIKFLESGIKAAKERMKFLKERLSQLVFLSPIAGKVISSFSTDTLLNVTNYDGIVLHTPIKISDMNQIKIGQTIKISLTGFDHVYNGEILSINKEVKFIDGQQVIFVSLLLENFSNQLLPGMVVENSLTTGATTLFEHIKRLVMN
ncbi:MAG: hypothetical protein HYS25_02870 [Ignavibacteriales bacterium]|nr:hypothetical protein [Ignavibacteriales bacterium]